MGNWNIVCGFTEIEVKVSFGIRCVWFGGN